MKLSRICKANCAAPGSETGQQEWFNPWLSLCKLRHIRLDSRSGCATMWHILLYIYAT